MHWWAAFPPNWIHGRCGNPYQDDPRHNAADRQAFPCQVGSKLVTMLTHPEAVECIRLVKIDSHNTFWSINVKDQDVDPDFLMMTGLIL